MRLQQQTTLEQFGRQVTEYMPTLFAGLVVLGAGAIAGWLLKRAVVRVLVLLRLDRLGGGRSAWRAAMGKGDVRAALYDGLGTASGAILFLVFVDNALQILGLEVLARLVDQIIFYIPTLALGLLIAGVGFGLSGVFARRVEALLMQEGIPRRGLLVGMARGAFLSVVGALAMWELDFAREIVLAAFLIGFGAVGVAFALAVGIGSARAIEQSLSAVMSARADGPGGGRPHREPVEPQARD